MAPADRPTLAYRLLRGLLLGLLRNLTRFDARGMGHVPAEGAVILAPNHLHVLDAVVVFALSPRRLTVFAAEKWEHTPVGWFMRLVANAIFVVRGEPDRQALASALEVLRRGGALGLAPEGTRSRTGGLIQGKNGAVYLAARTGAVIIPVACWGQEHVFSSWLRLRRAEVHAHFLAPFTLPAGADRARTADLQGYTDDLMLRLARNLPPAYRGMYADRVGDDGATG